MSGTVEPLLRLTPEEREEVRVTLRWDGLSPRVRERLEMVKAADLGHDLKEIAAFSGRTARTVRRWLRAFTAGGGIGALADAPRPGRPVRADAAYLRALEKAVETSPRELGLGFDVWTSQRLGTYLQRTTGVKIASGWLRVLLGRICLRCGRPKHTLEHLRDPEEVAACEAELSEAKKSSPGARALRVALPRRDAPGDQPLPV
jgi:transposase